MAEFRLRNDRLRSGAGVALVHALLGYALITGLAYDVPKRAAETLKLFDVSEPPPPPEEPPPPESRNDRAEGEASPENLRSRATPVVAPPAKIPKPPPLPVAPKPTPVPGNDPSAGASDRPGPGTGAGGSGDGTGSGGSGTGSGSGGGNPAERVSGQIANSDYPRSALRAGVEGTVKVRYTVGTDGRASGCTVIGSSGDPNLDSTTCRLIERRFRYRPARDRSGRPVAETVRRTFDWYIPARRLSPAGEP